MASFFSNEYRCLLDELGLETEACVQDFEEALEYSPAQRMFGLLFYIAGGNFSSASCSFNDFNDKSAPIECNEQTLQWYQINAAHDVACENGIGAMKNAYLNLTDVQDYTRIYMKQEFDCFGHNRPTTSAVIVFVFLVAIVAYSTMCYIERRKR
jgi:hypothetical protein